MSWIAWMALLSVALFIVWNVQAAIRLKRKPGMSRLEFAATLGRESIPERIAGAVYDHYSQGGLGVRGVLLDPADKFDDLQYGGEDLDEDLQQLVKRLSIEFPLQKVMAGNPITVDTIGNVACWLNWLEQHQNDE